MARTTARISVEGIENLNRRAGAIKTAIFEILGAAALEGADIVKDNARTRARVKSGMLASGVVSAVTWDKRAPIAFAGAGMSKTMNNAFIKISANGKRYYYPASIEYGHPGAPAYPFMRPAMTKNRAKVKAAISARVRAAIEGAVR